MLKSYKTEIYVNNEQRNLLIQHIGCARFTFNWALGIKKEAFDKKEKIPNYVELSRRLTVLKKEKYPWFYNCSSSIPTNALIDCDRALDNFFNRCKKKVKGKKGFPKFKSKKNPIKSCRFNGKIKIEDNIITLPKVGEIRLLEKGYIPENLKILSATISTRAGRWFVSVNVEEPDIPRSTPKVDILGVDLGIKTLAVCSDGTEYSNPKALESNLKKLKRLQRKLSRQKKGSKNREKTKAKIAKLHYKISNIRKDCLHKSTTGIVQKANVIVLENLKVSNMLKNDKLSRSISDVGFYEFRRQIEYKAKWNNRSVIFADTFYPSSKLCSSCGWRDEELTLNNRVFKCKDCGLEIDRDLNASLNLEKFGTESSSGSYASGDGSSPSLSDGQPVVEGRI